MLMSRSYRNRRAFWWHTITTAQLALVVAHVVVGVWLHQLIPVVVLSLIAAARHRSRSIWLLCIVGGALGIVASQAAWAHAAPQNLGAFSGSACLVTDPTPKAGATQAVFEVGGQRFEAWARGSPRRRINDHLAGECATIAAERKALMGVPARRAAIRHVVGGLQLQTVGDWSTGTPIARASNRVRRLFAQGAAQLRSPDNELFAGLVIGDDRNEPIALIQQFRASGLSHLTAVSGQNVSFVLAAAAPLLRRFRPAGRWLITLALITWFAALTRFEPSVLRAGVMAGIAATGYFMGRERPALRLLTLAVGALVLIDPMLVWSVGFWLSVGATAGVALLGTALVAYIPGPRWLAVPAAVTIGAQCGVAPVSLLVFGTLPLVSIPANLLAVPVAGFVMLYGLPAGLIAGALRPVLGGTLSAVVQMPSAIATRWVATVAALGARFEPSPGWGLIGWSCIAAALVARIVAIRFRSIWQG